METGHPFAAVQNIVAFIVEQCKLFGRQYIQLSGYFTDTYITVEADVHLACVFGSFLGRDYYYTVGAARTVDSGGRSVFQDVDAFNLSRVEAGHTVFAGITVNDVERFVALSHGDATAYINGNRGTRTAFTL